MMARARLHEEDKTHSGFSATRIRFFAMPSFPSARNRASRRFLRASLSMNPPYRVLLPTSSSASETEAATTLYDSVCRIGSEAS